MKKILFTAALFSACTFVMAQDTPSEFKPAAGANNLELNLTPLGNNPISITNIRYRRFLTATTALRIGVGVSMATTSVESAFASKTPAGITAGTMITAKSTTSKFGWNIRPGYEMHFAGTSRLSPYVGAELDLAGQSSKEVTATGVDATDVVGITTTKNKGKGGFFRVGAGVLAGFDCYITKHLYLGTEIGFGLQFVNFSKLKVEHSGSNTPIAPVKQPDDVDQGSTFNLGPNFNSAIRLGFIF